MANNKKNQSTPVIEPIKDTGNENPIDAKNYNPLTEEPVRDIPSNVNIPQDQLQQPIPEDSYQPPPVTDERHPLNEASEDEDNDDEGPTAQAPPPGNKKEEKKKQYFNDPNLEDLPPKQKAAASDQLAHFVMDRYQGAHDWANRNLQISKEKITKLQAAGELDLRAPIPYEDGFMRAGEYFREWNKDMETAFVMDPEWRADMQATLSRILAKRGMGLSDEAKFLLGISMDMGFKVRLYFGFRSQTNAMFDLAREMSAKMQTPAFGTTMDRPYYTEPPPTPPQPQYQQQSTPPPQYQQPPEPVQQTPPPAASAFSGAAQENALGELGITGNGAAPGVEQMALPKRGNRSRVHSIDKKYDNPPIKSGNKKNNKKKK
jgi:hypothetical protein